MLANDGKGTFKDQPALDLGTNVSSVSLADLEGDGDLDAAALDYGAGGAGAVFLLRNDGGSYRQIAKTVVGAAPNREPKTGIARTSATAAATNPRRVFSFDM